jgi:large exoprotein involved in heme utilization and adhesion
MTTGRPFPLLFVIFLSVLLHSLFFIPTEALAEVTLDGTLGGPSGAVAGRIIRSQKAWAFVRGGQNLFHSFGKFNIATGESATFSGSRISGTSSPELRAVHPP